MWHTILLNIVLSIIIIFAAHHIWEYCKSNYTVKKTKNLIESRESKYKSMLENISNSEELAIVKQDSTNIPPQQQNNFVALDEKEWMQKELDRFIDGL